MKGASVVFIFLMNINHVNAQIKNSLSEQKLKGKVITVTDRVYVAEDTILKQDSKLLSKTINRFTDKGFLILSESYDNKEIIKSYSIYRYDTITGLKLEERNYFPDSIIKERTLYKYDQHGNLIEEKIFEKNDSLKPAQINKYDINAKDEPEFDTDEEKIEIVITTRHRNIDKQGNWLTEITFEKKHPVSITKREIEYFVKPATEE